MDGLTLPAIDPAPCNFRTENWPYAPARSTNPVAHVQLSVARSLLFSLSRRQGVAPTEILSIPNDDRNLDAFDPEPGEPATALPLIVVVEAGAPLQPPTMPAPFSRLEATQARRARKTARTLSQRRATVRQVGAQVERATASLAGYGLALCVMIALRCDSFAHLVGRATRRASRSTRRAGLAVADLSNAGLRTVARARQRASSLRRDCASAIHGMADAQRARQLRHHESEGSLVAVVLAMVVIGYGGLLSIPWRHPGPTVPTSAVAAAHAVTTGTTNAEPTHAVVAVAPMTPDLAVDTRPRVRVMNTSTLNTIWRRNDTRSLQQAFTGLRRETLAFHRCSMKMTAADRAVARCDGVAGRTTFDFQRSGGRWAIRRVTNR